MRPHSCIKLSEIKNIFLKKSSLGNSTTKKTQDLINAINFLVHRAINDG